MVCFLRHGVAVLVWQPFAIRRRAPLSSGDVSVHVARNPRPVCAKNAAFSAVLCLDRCLCAVMISFVFTQRLIENEMKPFPLRKLRGCCLNGLLRASILSSVAGSRASLQVFSGSFRPSTLRWSRSASGLSCRRTSDVATSRREFPRLPSLMGVSLILVQVSSSTDLSVSFSQMSLVFCSKSSSWESHPPMVYHLRVEVQISPD